MTRIENSSALSLACLLLLACSGTRPAEPPATAGARQGAAAGAESGEGEASEDDARRAAEATTSAEVDVRTPIAGASDAGASADVREAAEGEIAEVADSVAVPTAVDHSSTLCPWGRTRYRLDKQVFEGMERESRASRRRRRHAWSMRPGQVLRFEATLRNVSDEPIVISERLAATYRSGHSALFNELVETQLMGPLAAGQELRPGAMIRMCGEFRIPDTPLYAFSDDGREALYYLNDYWGGVQVRYPPERGAAREPTSWGGMVSVSLVDGASLLDVCRQEHLRIARGRQLHSGQGVQRPGLYVQVPRDSSVAQAVERLTLRPDVISAEPLNRGDPGTEGCSEYAPCGAGQVCCYLCGIAGCPMSCYAGSSCPTGIP